MEIDSDVDWTTRVGCPISRVFREKWGFCVDPQEYSLPYFSYGSRLFFQSRLRLLNNVINHFLQILGLLNPAPRPVRSASLLQNFMDVIQFFARTQFIHHIVDKLQILMNQI